MKVANPNFYDKQINTSIDKSLGYLYFMDKSHPLSTKTGRVYYHRHVYSLKIGKWIDSSYHVHHKDGNKLNNSFDNLEAISPSKHGRLHNSGGKFSKRVFKCRNCGKKFIGVNAKECGIKCSIEFRGRISLFNGISKHDLQSLIDEMPITHIAIKLGCSDVMVHKMCKKMCITKKPLGFWIKKQKT